MLTQQSQGGQRRDLVFRTVVTECQRILAPAGFQLTDRGRVHSMALVGFRRDTERVTPVTQQTVLVVGHDTEARLLRAQLYGPHPQVGFAWQATYSSAGQVVERGREVVRTIGNWVAQLPRC
jgi:hypothetical protein